MDPGFVQLQKICIIVLLRALKNGEVSKLDLKNLIPNLLFTSNFSNHICLIFSSVYHILRAVLLNLRYICPGDAAVHQWVETMPTRSFMRENYAPEGRFA